MRRTLVRLGSVLFLAAGFSARAGAADGPDRTAAAVIVRGVKDFARALRAALPLRAGDAGASPVAVVIDVTPHTRKALSTLALGVAALREDEKAVASLRVGALGRPLSAPLPTTADAAKAVADAVRKDTPTDDTLSALRKTIGAVTQPGTVVVYVADWRFEDDFDLEGLIRFATSHDVTISTVGTEAAFLRGWIDGIRDPLDGAAQGGGNYLPNVGRSPFGPEKPGAPWHGGETAYPGIPYAWSPFFWKGEFQPDRDRPLESLAERLGGEPDPQDLLEALRTYPIPSAFGPYGLMRVAAETGGRYVLWSWNPSGRNRVQYEYTRCNLFMPDLRSRKEILATISRDDLTKAVLAAWYALAGVKARLVEVTPALERDRTPRSVDEVAQPGLNGVWDTPAEYRDCLRRLQEALAAVAPAARGLEDAIKAAGDPPTDEARRRQAEALLLSHTLAVLDFEVHEALLAMKALTDDHWKHEGEHPGLAPEAFIAGTGSPFAGLLLGGDSDALDPAAGERIRALRKEHLERFRGTPFAAQVELNDVQTYRIRMYRLGKLIERGRTPSESDGSVPPGIPGGGSGGGGPVTK